MAVGDNRQLQIRYNLSVSAAPSQHPYPLCPFGTFPPDSGNRPLEGEPGEGEKTRLLGSSREGALYYYVSAFDGAVGVEDGEFAEVDDVFAVLGVALCEDGHAAGDGAACLFDQLFHRAQRLAG